MSTREQYPTKARIEQHDLAPCQGCGLHATLRSLDVQVPALPAKGRGLDHRPAVPAGWCPLIALCGHCWDEMVKQLGEKRR